MHLLRLKRIHARVLLMRRLAKQPPVMYTIRSTNHIIHSVLIYDEAVTRMHLRISTKTFVEIGKFLPNKNHGWGPEMELLLFLLWLANGTSCRVVEAETDIPRSTIRDIIDKLLDFTIDYIMPRVITLPKQDDLPNIAHQFNRRARTTIFEKAAGAIGGTHIEIGCQMRRNDQYINRQLKYTIQCQAICDSNFKFVDVLIGHPGSMHESRVLYCSPVFNDKFYPPPGYYLLGDNAYPCRLDPITLITPFKEGNLNNDKRNFNKVFSAARNVVECAFLQMKVRWGSIFGCASQLNVEIIVKTVAAYCTIHNICILNNDDIPLLLLNAELEAFNDRTDEEIAYTLIKDQRKGIQLREILFEKFLKSR